MAATLDDCERTATVAPPTAASTDFISSELGIALDAFLTMNELPLTHFEIRQTDRQTDKHTDMNDHSTPLCATPTRGNKDCLFQEISKDDRHFVGLPLFEKFIYIVSSTNPTTVHVQHSTVSCTLPFLLLQEL